MIHQYDDSLRDLYHQQGGFCVEEIHFDFFFFIYTCNLFDILLFFFILHCLMAFLGPSTRPSLLLLSFFLMCPNCGLVPLQSPVPDLLLFFIPSISSSVPKVL